MKILELPEFITDLLNGEELKQCYFSSVEEKKTTDLLLFYDLSKLTVASVLTRGQFVAAGEKRRGQLDAGSLMTLNTVVVPASTKTETEFAFWLVVLDREGGVHCAAVGCGSREGTAS